VVILLAQILVAGAGGFPSVGSAIRAAHPGDTVLVRSGVHYESLVIDKAIVLMGEPGAVLDGGGSGDVIRVTGSGAVIEHLVVQHSGSSLGTDDAAIRIRASDVRVSGVMIRRSLHGIYVQDAAFVTLANDTIFGNTALAEPDRGNGIHLHASRHIRMERNVIERTRDGIYFSYADSTEAIGNTVTHVRYGVHYMFSRGNRFVANRFSFNAAGAALMNSWDLVAAGNTFSDHTSYRGYGIALQTTEHARLIGNRFERNTIGVFADNASGGAIGDNLFAGNGVGLDLTGSVEANVIVGNVFLGNGVAARRASGTNTNRWTDGGRGNYWQGSTMLDLDHDGIADLPHREGSAFSSLAVRRPALALWRDSPAMAVLDLAERSLPVFNAPVIVDSAPLTRVPRDFAAMAPSGPAAPRGRLLAMGLVVGLIGIVLMGGLQRGES
jgi:nitrous oxidase accessory protein